MIWMWITLAVILSAIPLIRKKIDIANYIWLLLPIDSYGIAVGGTSIRPYMIFAFILPIIMYAKNKGKDFDLSIKKGQLMGALVCVLIFIHSIFLSNGLTSVKAALYLLLVYTSVQLSTSCTSVSKSDKLCDVLIACSFGYSIVFVLAYLCVQLGVDIGGLVAATREEPGLVMRMGNVANGRYFVTMRLRGFMFDPNVMFLQFFYSIPACISKLFKKGNLYHIFTLVLSVICIIFSGSRMGLICSILAITLTVAVFIIQLDSVKKKVIGLVTALASGAGVMSFIISPWGKQAFSRLISNYSKRSSLIGQYGRFTVWAESLRIYWHTNPLLGVGLTQMNEYSSIERTTHNTWLQLICECGFFVGSAYVVYFFATLIYGWLKIKSKPKKDPVSVAYLCILIGYTITMVSLSSVDNYASSYLWIGALMLIKFAPYNNVTNRTLQK